MAYLYVGDEHPEARDFAENWLALEPVRPDALHSRRKPERAARLPWTLFNLGFLIPSSSTPTGRP